MNKPGLHKGLSALLEIGILFLPGIPAFFWLWPNVKGASEVVVEIVVYMYLLAGCLFIGLRRWNLSELGLNRQGIWLSLVCGLGLLGGRTLVILAVGWPGVPEALTPQKILGDILFYFGLIGVIEELIFRGLMYRALQEWRGHHWAIWGSTLGFILYHIGWRSPAQALGALIIGVIFAAIRWRAGGIVGLILVHGAIDVGSVWMLPELRIEDMGTPEIVHPIALITGYLMILAIPIYLWRYRGELSSEVESELATLRKEVEASEKINAAHTFLQSVVDGVAEPIMVIDEDYHVELMNKAAREFMTGDSLSPEPVLCYQISHKRETPCDGIEHPCPLKEVVHTNQSVTLEHKHLQASGEWRLVEFVAAPLMEAGGAFQGIIEVMRDITEQKQAEEALIQYTQQLRTLTTKLAEVEEAERQRLARELHDRVGRNLTALGLNLNIVQEQFPEDIPDTFRSRLDDSLSLLAQTAERIRDVMADLRPPVLDDYGLVAALRWYGEQYTRRTNIFLNMDGEEPIPRLSQRSENTLFRIAQEALTNVAKHAQATEVKIALKSEKETVSMVIADDGIGFNPDNLLATDKDKGWGLLTMTERAEAVGGRCRIISSPDRGTQVIVEVPR